MVPNLVSVRVLHNATATAASGPTENRPVTIFLMGTLWAWATSWNWSQFMPDVIVATITGLAVAVALQWSARRTESRNARERAKAALSPYALTLEMELADGVKFEAIGSAGAISLRPARDFREMLERARCLESDLDERAMEEARQTIFLQHICMHLDTMQREGAKIEQEAGTILRRAPQSDANYVRLRVDALRDAILQNEANEELVVEAFPDVFADGTRATPTDGRSFTMQERLRFYLASRRIADTAARAYADYCVSMRESAFVEGLEMISTAEQVEELRKNRREAQIARDASFEAAIDEVQRYAGGC